MFGEINRQLDAGLISRPQAEAAFTEAGRKEINADAHKDIVESVANQI